MMCSCPRPARCSARLSALMCCSGSWRSWPGSAMPSMGASWRSSPRSIATGCGVPPGHGRWRGWWPGSLGTSEGNAKTITTVAQRGAAFPRCVGQLQQGRLSLDQVGVIAARAGRDPTSTTPSWRRWPPSTSYGPRSSSNPPDPDPHPQPQASITKNTDEHFTWWRIKLPHAQAATLDAAINAHREALITDWKQARGDASQAAPPRPGDLEAFLRWSRPAGTPRPPAARTVRTPPWWCTSTSRSAPPPCTWDHC